MQAADFADQLGRLVRHAVVADDPHQRHLAAERGDIAGDIAGAAQHHGLRLVRHDRHRRLRRQTRRFSVHELIDHQVADAHGPSAFQTGQQALKFG